ncbi:MAG: hypothetical protein VKP62_11305 [Candidatus Sericytochromatia bacterium]|nr:hypothetical protein [Candidatus Sericytochromatia bacterium]
MSVARSLIISLDAEWSLAPGLSAHLAMAGHPVLRVPHGVAALVALATRRFDLLFVEVLDLARHGRALGRIVRERPAHRALPLVALTQDLPTNARLALLEAGFDLVLSGREALDIDADTLVALLQARHADQSPSGRYSFDQALSVS